MEPRPEPPYSPESVPLYTHSLRSQIALIQSRFIKSNRELSPKELYLLVYTWKHGFEMNEYVPSLGDLIYSIKDEYPIPQRLSLFSIQYSSIAGLGARAGVIALNWV